MKDEKKTEIDYIKIIQLEENWKNKKKGYRYKSDTE